MTLPMTLRLTTMGLLLTAAVATAAPAFAQLPPARAARPARSVFGGGQKPAAERLTIGASFGAGYDDDMSAPTPGIPSTVHSGQYASVITNAKYAIDRDAVRGDISFNALVRYYGETNSPPLGTYSGGGSLSWSLGTKTSMSATVRAGSYLNTAAIFGGDAYSFDPFQSQVPFVPIDSSTFSDGSTYNSLYGGAQFSHRLNDRVDMGAGYAYYANNAWTAGVGTTYGVHTGNGGINFHLGKGFGLRAGYAYSGGGFGIVAGTAPSYAGHSFDGGLTYAQSLSVTRRSSLSFSTSLSTITDHNLNTRVFAGGSASFSYEIGRSWDTGVHYNRAVDFYQMLGQPTFSDTINFSIGGGIGRRVQVSGSGGLILGTVGVATGAPGYDATHAGAGVRFGLSRHIGLSVNYAYYRYEYDSSVLLPPGLLSSMQRQIVRVSFDVWAPIYERARRANAAR
jgi:hypothetical protein